VTDRKKEKWNKPKLIILDKGNVDECCLSLCKQSPSYVTNGSGGMGAMCGESPGCVGACSAWGAS
jgi:hypothetical protein